MFLLNVIPSFYLLISSRWVLREYNLILFSEQTFWIQEAIQWVRYTIRNVKAYISVHFQHISSNYLIPSLDIVKLAIWSDSKVHLLLDKKVYTLILSRVTSECYLKLNWYDWWFCVVQIEFSYWTLVHSDVCEDWGCNVERHCLEVVDNKEFGHNY